MPLHFMPFTRKLNVINEPGRSSGLGFTFPSANCEQWFEEFYSGIFLQKMQEAFTATGIAPDFNGIPF
jgi:hypothetical protein